MSDDFDWTSRNSSLVLTTQMARAIFENERGEIALRQQADSSWQEDDSWVYFSKDRALTVVRSILEVAGIDPATAFRDTSRGSFHAQTGNENSNITPAGAVDRDSNRDTSATAPKDKTAADRQRRYRERHADRNAVTRDTVTPPLLLAAE